MLNRSARLREALRPGGLVARLLFSVAGLAGIVALSQFLN